MQCQNNLLAPNTQSGHSQTQCVLSNGRAGLALYGTMMCWSTKGRDKNEGETFHTVSKKFISMESPETKDTELWWTFIQGRI